MLTNQRDRGLQVPHYNWNPRIDVMPTFPLAPTLKAVFVTAKDDQISTMTTRRFDVNIKVFSWPPRLPIASSNSAYIYSQIWGIFLQASILK